MNKILTDIQERIKNGKCEVIGLGRSNFPLIDYLIKNGAASIRARDLKEPKNDIRMKYETSGVEFIIGEGYLEDLGGSDTVIFRTPAVRPDLVPIAKAVSAGAVLSSEMELFLMLTPAKKFAVTGSDGKTTTTTLIKNLLACNTTVNTFVGGNIGRPLLPDLDEMKSSDNAVLELSSFQLMGINTFPDIAVVTNISENHLNWHVGMEEYVSAKSRIFSNECERLIINADNAVSVDALKRYGTPAKITAFSSRSKGFDEIASVLPSISAAIYLNDGKIVYREKGKSEKIMLDTGKIKIPGMHNVENYMCAIGATYGYVSLSDIDKVAETFKGVEHRLEFVRELNGVEYYNSSIDSSPTRTRAALSALKKKPVIICGGSDKNIPFEPLAEALCDMAKKVILVGDSAPKILKSLKECKKLDSSGIEIIQCASFREAINRAHDVATPGDIVLLSPACASFDMFRDFEERGRTFKSLVMEFDS